MNRPVVAQKLQVRSAQKTPITSICIECISVIGLYYLVRLRYTSMFTISECLVRLASSTSACVCGTVPGRGLLKRGGGGDVRVQTSAQGNHKVQSRCVRLVPPVSDPLRYELPPWCHFLRGTGSNAWMLPSHVVAPLILLVVLTPGSNQLSNGLNRNPTYLSTTSTITQPNHPNQSNPPNPVTNPTL